MEAEPHIECWCLFGIELVGGAGGCCRLQGSDESLTDIAAGVRMGRDAACLVREWNMY